MDMTIITLGGYTITAGMIMTILVFATTGIVELIKDISFIKKIPTKITDIIIAQVVCFIALYLYIQYAQIQIRAWYLVAVVMIALFVALVASQGWEFVKELWDRCKPDSKEE